MVEYLLLRPVFLNLYSDCSAMTNTVFIISGAQGEGKTTRIKELSALLTESGGRLAGFIAEGGWEEGVRNGFTLKDIRSGENKRLCTTKNTEGWTSFGRFYFDPEVIQWGEELIRRGITDQADLFVIDEMGKFELAGNVWHDAFVSLVHDKKPVLVTVRTSAVNQFVAQFNLEDFQLYKLTDDKQQILNKILEAIK